ncbi:MAG TPA: CoA transferase, partial [Acidimicrobiales bacterium]|nr:CoA transferase [Acidimicrobiales bacterium]
ADKGGYDSLAFWARPGVALGVKNAEQEDVPHPPGPGFGDSIGAMTIAGGIMGALFHRERTGEATTVDVSLFGTGLWAQGQAIALSTLLNAPFSVGPATRTRLNPLVGNYKTKDGHFLALCCLQAGAYWPAISEVLERPDVATDPRFADHESLVSHGAEAAEVLRQCFGERTLAEWRDRLADFPGQWTVVQDTLEAAADPQTIANGYILECTNSTGVKFQLVTAPVQFDGAPAQPRRAPEFNEHGDEILAEIGLDTEAVLDLKVRGVVA